jgi:UDP-N-acetylglucosamine 2-epimerase
MKIVTIVGARPQFIKSSPVSRELLLAGAEEVMIHTGQHYDPLMSQVFFETFRMPRPKHELGVGSGNHGHQTGKMLAAVEDILMSERPDWVLVYGDTNSTLAGALAAAKLHIPVAHVEAGLRSYNRRMPEEINRVLTDHMATLLLVPSEVAQENLRREGISEGVRLVGDVMYDAAMEHREIARENSRILAQMGLEPKGYMLATVHRAENTDASERLSGIAAAFRELCTTETIIWPVHPRTRKYLHDIGLESIANLRLIDPVSYLDMLQLEDNARVVLTDSGGVQKEAQWFETPCVTLRDETEWVETVALGWNQLAGTNCAAIVAAVRRACRPEGTPAYCTPGAAGAIANLLMRTGSYSCVSA